LALLVLAAMSFVTALSGAAIPGPVLFVTVRQSVVHGRWVGPLIVLGHAVVEIPMVLLIALGLESFLTGGMFLGIVGLAGGTMLVVMAAMMLRALPGLELPDAAAGNAPPMRHLKSVFAGGATSLATPAWPLWWATIGLGFMANQARPLGAAGYVVFYLAHVMGDLVWYAAVSESVHRGRKLLSNRSYRWLVGVCAALLIVFAGLFMHMGYGHLAGTRGVA
jgi:threonine/homoserine/homoserine lactone efflux protein